ncbi:DNA polymerase I [Conchiformibius kuhniae]|uniref:DNA polymerase I n=1 Tax=Conchiformibius kuhniae TaxID=211502 RepID=A0ABD8B6Z6_9NEIS|nr:DNA polymerase I [Conchiformibius kuhniae]
MSAPTLLLVDGSSYLYRAFYAMTHLSAPDGTPTNAVYGVLNMLRRARSEIAHDHCACVFDAKGSNFRHRLYPDYKATRPPMPDDLRPQAQMLPELVRLLGWTVLQTPDVEADDVIATLATQAQQRGWHTIISTGDKDMAQLVNPHITLVNTMSDETLDRNGVYAKFGVYPEQIADYLSLVGDKVDNVPGVEKCGPKTAAKWLAQYGSLDQIIAHADAFGGKIGEHLRGALAHLPLAKQLVRLKTDVDLHAELPEGLDSLRRRDADWTALATHFERLGFKSWLKEAREHGQGTDTPAAPSAPPTPVPAQPVAHLHYRTITNEHDFQALLQRLANSTRIGLDTETDSLDAMRARLVGISIAFAAGDAAYIPLAHNPALTEHQLDADTVLPALKPHLENPQLHKIGQNLKYDRHVFANHGIGLQGIAGDAMLASYIVESHLGHGLDELAQRWLGLPTVSYEDLCGKGAKQIPFADVPLPQASDYACQDADFALRIETHLRAQMDAAQQHMYENMELPVAEVLFAMERAGVHIDTRELAAQSRDLGRELLDLEQKAYALAGQPFNLNSPKQLQEILFRQMGIPTKGLKKTASGGVSTNEAVLEQLALDYPLPKLILQHRSVAKLKSTYTDKLPEMVSPHTGRVHTTYAQAVAITGRLASSNPNLQNIPVRTEAGRRVRRAFTAPAGFIMVSADYSQIELRIMAHLSGDATLLEAFRKGEDIHRRTAAEVFGIAPEQVGTEQRRYAKTINFGLIYGMGQYGLAKALGIDNLSAKNFIERYFARYTGVADYMRRTKEQAAEQGYVQTLFGRRLYLPDIRSRNAVARAAAERAAINAPMQGTASDLMKRAMIAVHRWLGEHSPASLTVMQVHDELVLQVPEAEQERVCAELPHLMAQAGADVLDVPLTAQVGAGADWEAAH